LRGRLDTCPAYFLTKDLMMAERIIKRIPPKCEMCIYKQATQEVVVNGGIINVCGACAEVVKGKYRKK
jgi:ribosome-binding protein aMBF1 (putative translation factor)